MGVVIDLAPVLLIVLGKEVIDVLFLRVLREISLHDFQAQSIDLHALYIGAKGVQEPIAPFTLEIGNDALINLAPCVCLVPGKKAF
jgi:hypothetical protein